MTPSTLDQLDAVRASCRKLVMTRSAASAAVSAIPIPGPDVLADVGMLMEMIPVINRRFGLSPEQIEELPAPLQGAIMGTATRMGSALVGKTITKELIIAVLKRVGVRVTAKTATKFVPVLGSVVSAGISFTAMRLLGNRHVDDCYHLAKSLLELQAIAGATSDDQPRRLEGRRHEGDASTSSTDSDADPVESRRAAGPREG